MTSESKCVKMVGPTKEAFEIFFTPASEMAEKSRDHDEHSKGQDFFGTRKNLETIKKNIMGALTKMKKVESLKKRWSLKKKKYGKKLGRKVRNIGKKRADDKAACIDPRGTDDTSLSVRYEARCNGTTESIIMCIDGVLSRETTVEMGRTRVPSGGSVGSERVRSREARETNGDGGADIYSALSRDATWDSGEDGTPRTEARDAEHSDDSAARTGEGPTARCGADRQAVALGKKPTRSVGYNRDEKRRDGRQMTSETLGIAKEETVPTSNTSQREEPPASAVGTVVETCCGYQLYTDCGGLP